MDAIGATSQVVYLSSETLAKQKGLIPGNPGHPELTFEDYQSLPDVISKAQLVVQDRESTIVFFKKGDQIFYAVVKATASGETLFLTSFRKAEMTDIAEIKKKGKVLKNDL